MYTSGLQREHVLTGASRSRSIKPSVIALAVAACFSGGALANPTNPTVVHGTASFQQAGNILNITNSHNAIINWGSFSISVGELTRFIQPSALSAVLNRVTGQDPSAILGALQSNGRVFLLNPNGIVFGAGSQINVAGLVASTLNLSNEDFLNNRMRFTDGAGAGSVVNNGSITGGSVYLVGNAVTNNGLITSPGGEVVLAAGNSVELVNPGTPNLRVEVVAPDNEARNLGTVTAEAGRIGIYAGLIHNSGMLNASSAVAEGGRILLKAKKDITLTSTSVIDASGKGGGEIIALADNNTYVDGTLKASAPVSGNGGFIETSGKNRVKIADSAIIDTTAAQGVKGTWLIDPNDFVIAAGYGGDISGANLSSLLNSADVVISTAAYGGPNYFYGSGAYGGSNGDILVNDAVSWNSDSGLTLTAQRHVVVNQAITNLGTGDVKLNAGWDGITDPAASVLTNQNPGSIMLNAPVSTNGNVYLHAVSDITQSSSAPVMASSLLALSDMGAVKLADATNGVGTLAGGAMGSFAFKNSGDLVIGSVGGTNGITVDSYAGNGLDASINVAVTGGQLTVSRPVYARGGDGGEGQAGGNATITLSSSSSMQINSIGPITADGGEGGYGYFSPAGNGGNATVTLTSGGGLMVNGSVNANGGMGGYGDSGVNGGQGGNGVVDVNAAGTLTIAAYGGVVGQGGTGGYAEGGEGGGATAGRGGDGKVMMTAGAITVENGGQSGGQVRGEGGGGGSFYYYYGDPVQGGRGGDGVVQLTSSGNMDVMGEVSARGGWGGEGGEGGATGSGGNASVSLASTSGAMKISGGWVHADGGEGPYTAVAGTGGMATVNISSAGATTIENYADVFANGGDGGTAGGGGLVLVSASGGLTVSNSILTADGGSAAAGQGGAAGLTLLAGGNIQFEGAEGQVYGGDGNIGGDAGILMVAGGNIVLDSSYYYDTLNAVGGGNTPGMKSVIVAAAGNVSLINGAGISSTGTVGLGGANISLDDNSYVDADSTASVGATGSLSLTNGSSVEGYGNAYIATGGNVTVDGDSSILGNPDVFMTVGGVIHMNNGGTVAAGAPTTIHVTFPMLTSGGYFVNGVEGVVSEGALFSGGTGFFADGSGAILGTNLLVTYGGGVTLNIPTDALIVAMGQSTKPPDPEKDKDVFEEIGDEKKKDAPICR